ncbi:MAG: site-2 protease family protein [Candidatus Gottesmanbacteria bacterium]
MITEIFTNPLMFIVWTIALLVAITIHEFSHALMADRLGDPTAKLMGRLTLNPFAHLDPIGTLFLLLVRFGWGKPVPIDPFNLRSPRRDSAIISLAGPVSNLILATVLSLILRLITFLPLSMTIYMILQLIFIPIIILNVTLAIFNCLPVSPLDGYKIVGGFLPKNLQPQWDELEGYGIIFLLLLLFPFTGGPLLTTLFDPILNFVLHLLLPSLGTIV